MKKPMRRMLLALLLPLWACTSPPSPAPASYLPQDGDIIFHTSRSAQSVAVQRVTGSAYSHMGLLILREGRPLVLEAVQPVKFTPLDQWISRGVDGHFVVRRLSRARTLLTDEALARIKALAREYQGRSYDPTFSWSDEQFYCSELVYKIFQRALNLNLGKLQKMADFDISDPEVRELIQQRFGGALPAKETVISPAAIFESELLVTVYSR